MPQAVVTWSSGDPSVAAVDASGLVTAVGNGSTVITASSGTVTGSATAMVAQIPGEVALSPSLVELSVGDTLRLSARATDTNGHPVTGAVFSWSSANASVASVDDSGLVTGVSVGEVVVRASLGSASGSASVRVSPPPVPPEPVGTMPDRTVEAGQTATVDASAYFSDPDGGALSYAAESSDPRVATADVSGSILSVEATGPGTATVTVTATDPDGLSAEQSFGVVVSGSVEDDFESAASLNDWEGENADLAVADGALTIANQTEGRLGLAKRRGMPSVNEWTIQARIGRTGRRARPGVVSLTGHGRFTAVRLVLRTLDDDDDRDRGGVTDAAVTARNYEFAVFDGGAGEWVLVRNLSGRSESVVEEPGRYTEIAFGHEGGDFAAYAGENGAEELFRFDLATTSLEGVALGEILSDVTGLWLANEGPAGSTALHDRVRVTGTGSDATPPDEGEISDAPGEATRSTGVELPVASVRVTPAADSLALGDTLRLSAEAYDADGRTLAGAEFSWSSSDESLATVDASGLVTGVAEGTATITVTSGGVSASSEIGVFDPRRPVSVTVSPSTDSVAVGETLRLSAEAFASNGRAVVGAEFSWSSSDESVATVDASGLVTGVAEGSATITVTSGGVSASSEIGVFDPTRPVSVTVSPSTGSVAVGETLRLSAQAVDTNGRAVVGAEFSWSSSDESVATVDASGLVTGVAEGSATITVSTGGVSGSADISVFVPAGPVSVGVSPWSGSVAVGATLSLSAEAYDANGRPVAGAEFSWSSSDESVATVDAEGLVTGVAEGTATITATTDDISGSAEISVFVPSVPVSVTVSPSTGSVAVGATLSMSAQAFDANGRVVADPQFSWSSSDESAATVDASGLVTGVAEGTATITATTDGVSGSAEISVFVPDVPVSVRVSPSSGSVTVGGTLSLSAQAFDAKGRVVADARFSWSSRDESVATVNASGLVTGVAEGTATITASTGGVSGSATVSVSAPAVPVSVTVSPSTGSVAVGATLNLSAQALDANGRAVAGAQFSWSSSDESVATVDASGLVTGLAEGAGTITATTDGVSGSADISVFVPTVPVSVTVSPSTGSVAVGATLSLSAQAFDANGRVVARAQFSWSSSDQSVATVDASGLVTGVAAGSATITASTGGVSGLAGVTVTNPGNSADRTVLVALYNATDGPNWTNSEKWLTNAPLGDWYGVDTDDQGRVSRIALYNNSLTGSIPSELGDLTDLTVLGLSRNQLTGSIPSELGDLTNLTSLALWGNELTGSIPSDLGDLTNLTGLLLGWNELTGSIPSDLGDLAKLTTLSLTTNDLTGVIPSELGDLANLTRLGLGGNSLTGSIPPELGKLTNLTYLGLGDGLTGSIPSEFGNLVNLETLELAGSDLTGSIPPEFGSLTQLRVLRLFENDLTGPIPPELGELANLEELTLYDNGLTGSIPPELGELANLIYLALSSNSLTGSIPSELGDLANLARLYLHDNGLTGSIPPELGELANLTELGLGSNSLTGSIPSELGDLANLARLDLNDNGLTSSIPSELGDLAKLTELTLDDNGLTGRLPDGLLSLSLDLFRWNENAGLCAPDTSAFRAWLAAIKYHQPGPFCSGSGGRRRITQTGPGEVGPTGAVPGRSP